MWMYDVRSVEKEHSSDSRHLCDIAVTQHDPSVTPPPCTGQVGQLLYVMTNQNKKNDRLPIYARSIHSLYHSCMAWIKMCFSYAPGFEYSVLMMCKYITVVRASVSVPQCNHTFFWQDRPPEAHYCVTSILQRGEKDILLWPTWLKTPTILHNYFPLLLCSVFVVIKMKDY